MFRDINACAEYLEVGSTESLELTSWRRPIVILKNNEKGKSLAESVSNGFNTTGAMLPYMPFHYLLFEKLDLPAIVLTSGNLSEEPVIIDNTEAVERLDKLADAFLLYNRDIYNRTDDSVMMVTGNRPRLIRRSRGYAPSAVNLRFNVDGIVAAGAELVNCFCLGKEQKAFMSQHIGDLRNLETLSFYQEAFERFSDMFRVRPRIIACDLHPDYLSTRFAEKLAALSGNIPIVRIQHHHAHIASCMAEHGLDEKVIGISLDGVGYGTDGHIWGFEVMLCDLAVFERKTHLEYLLQPGGDMANHEPWRMALSYLHQYVDKDVERLDLPFLNLIDAEKIKMIKTGLDFKINAPLTSSAGRLFDAVAALTGICTRSDFHAEAPMRLENIIDPNENGYYEFDCGETINPGPVIHGIIGDLRDNVPVGVIAARFHRAVVNVIINSAIRMRNESGITKVVLSGGTFQNRFLLSESEKRLREIKFEVFTQEKFPSNDGGIALGQLVIASKGDFF